MCGKGGASLKRLCFFAPCSAVAEELVSEGLGRCFVNQLNVRRLLGGCADGDGMGIDDGVNEELRQGIWERDGWQEEATGWEDPP